MPQVPPLYEAGAGQSLWPKIKPPKKAPAWWCRVVPSGAVWCRVVRGWAGALSVFCAFEVARGAANASSI
ncbi:hypothetical protein ACLKA7_004588 [Drosophila subpalustris]